MRKSISFVLTIMFCVASIAQERYMPENKSDYSQPTISRVRRVGTLATAPLPCMGSPMVPIVLVQFADTKFTVADTDEKVNALFDDFCNKPNGKTEGGSWGSIYDYFNEQSDGQFTPRFKVIGPVTLSEGFAYYGKDSSTGSRDVNIGAFFSESCKLAIAEPDVKWSDFDNNNDGKVDFVFFVFAGAAQNTKDADPNLIWPKESATQYTVTYGNQSVTFGGYGCCNELYKDVLDGIGTMCHELSHAIGLPDTYDYGYNYFGMDYHDVMDTGAYQMQGKQPCCYTAYERDFMGWRPIKEVEKDASVTLVLDPMEKNGHAYKILNDGQPSGNEYFILENRQNLGFDTYYGCPTPEMYYNYGTSHGLLITHIDYSSSAWNANNLNSSKHQRMTPVPADGVLNIYRSVPTEQYCKSLHDDLYPGSINKTELSSYDVYTGAITQTITNIVEHDDGTITVDINGGDPTAINGVESDAITTELFSVSGIKISALQPGLNIIRTTYPNGKVEVKKVFIIHNS